MASCKEKKKTGVDALQYFHLEVNAAACARQKNAGNNNPHLRQMISKPGENPLRTQLLQRLADDSVPGRLLESEG